MAADSPSPTPPLAPRAFGRWLWQLAKDVVNEFRDDGVGDLAAAITFWTILSIPAAVLALVSALSSLDDVIGSSLAADVERDVQQLIADTFTDSKPLSAAVDELFNSSSRGIATIALLVAIFTLSRAFAGLIRALDKAYEVDEGRPWWYLRLVAVGLGVATIIVSVGTVTFIGLLPRLPFSSGVRLLTGPAAFLVLIAWAATIFHIGPNHRTPWRYDLPGAIFTAIGWLATSQLYALYVRFAAGGNEVQGSVGAILLALGLMYLFAVVLLIGAELNDVIARRSGVASVNPSVQSRARWLRDRYRERYGGDENGSSLD